MPSSPIAAAAASPLVGGELWRVLDTVPDPRDRRGRRHRLPVILACGLAAVLAGARSFVAIGEWVAHQSTATLAGLGVDGAGPGESTIRRAFARLDGDLVDQVLGALLWTRTQRAGGRRVIAIDGKTVRGARTPTQTAPHLVAALDHQAGAVLGQLAVAAKSNEIPAVQRLLALYDLTDVVVTVDAMHTQTDTATIITDGGGDYVFTVKGNTPTLYRQLKELPWQQVPAHRATQTGHGRRSTRTIKVVDAPAWVGFPAAAQVAQVRRTVTRQRKKTVEVVYLITSADHDAAPPATLAAWVQGHWSIENKLHWVRDVTWDEDRSQIRTGSAPQVMATLRNTAISLLRLTGWTNIAAGLRHHARDPDHPLKLVLTW
jgi:predicted transposase YbfD/YdcC